MRRRIAPGSRARAWPRLGRARDLLARWAPPAALCAIWVAHLYYSVAYRPDVLVEDEWHVFTVPGYGRDFALENIFGVQTDTIAAYQNLIQYIVLITTDLKYPHYIAIQNMFLLVFVAAAWRLLATMESLGGGSGLRSAAIALSLVPAFAGTHHFLGSAMGFVHQMPMVWLVLALLAARSARLSRPLVGCLLFLSGAAYISGWMYLLAATLALAAVRLFAPEPAAKTDPAAVRSPGLPAWGAIAAAWIALFAVAALSVRFGHRPFPLLEQGTTHGNEPLVWPWDGRFWIFLLTTVGRGWGLPAGTGWGAAALALTLAPSIWLVARARRGSSRDRADAFALAAPVLGALFALAMVACGRGLVHGAAPADVAAFAARNPKYLLHMTFALPFAVAAWLRAFAAIPGAGGDWRRAAAAALLLPLAGYASGANGPLTRLRVPPDHPFDFRTIYDRGNAFARDAANCLDNAVRLARATGPDVPIRCPAMMISSVRGDLRAAIASAERAGVASIAGIPDLPPVSMEGARAAIAAAGAEGAPPAGRIEGFEAGKSWLRLAGRVAAAGDGALPHWIAVAAPGRPLWLARVGGTGGRWRAGPAGSFDVTVPAGERPSPAGARVWALDVGPGGEVAAAFPLLPPLVALLDAPPAGAAAPGGWIERAVWTPRRRTLEISGWALADGRDDGRRIGLYAPGAVSVARVEERERPDVVAAHGGDARLLRSGFSATLKFARGAGPPAFVCVRSEDRAFGRRALRGLPEWDPAACAPAR